MPFEIDAGTLDAVLAAGVERGAAPGVSMVVVDRDGAIYEGAAGERVIGSGVGMEVDTPGAIFSMTKALTGVAAMQLVEQGKLSLDDPASSICAELGETTVLDGFDADGQPLTRPPATPITLRHLLTHTSGFVYDIWNADSARWHEVTGEPSVLSQQLRALREPIMFDPGTRWEYGIGIDWAGQMVEAVSGLTLGQYLAEHVTGPLRMADTMFTPTADLIDRAAGMHARLPDGTFTSMNLDAPENPEFEMGGGGLFGTMPDYGRFIRMILNDGELDGVRVLAPETVEQMASNQMGDLRVQKLVSMAPPFSHDAEFFPGEPKSWGLTFQINEEAASTGRPAGTLMWAGLANSYYWIDREHGVGGTYLSQILPFADPGTLELFFEVETAVYGSMA